MNRSWNIRLALLASLAFALVAPATASAQQQQQKPNILVIMGDDIGYWNISAQALVAQHLESFKQFPPRQKPGSFSVEQAMEKLRNPPSSN
jgi:ABC-type sugar transport system substrate-binding protein